MLDFRHSSRKPPDYLGRKAQRQLLLLVLSLGLVIWLMNHARKPSSWYWLWGGKPVAGEGSRAAESASSADGGAAAEVDTRLAANSPTEPGIFISRSAATPATGDRQYFPGVRPGYFAEVQDDTPSRGAETEAWFHLFELLEAAGQRQLEQAAREVDFVQLFQQPAEFRGQLVTLQGRVRRAIKVAAPKNDNGIEAYYQVWLFPGANPVVAYCLELPQGFPTGERVNEEAALTGFFFKRLAYAAVDDIRTAPMLAAKTLSWSPAAQPLSSPQDPSALWWATLTGLVLAYAVLWGWRVTRRQMAARPAFRSENTQRLELDGAEVLPEPRAALGELAESEPKSERSAETDA